MSQENVELHHRTFDAFNRRDLEAFLARCDPDLEFISADPAASQLAGVRWLCREHADEVPQAIPDQLRSLVRLVAPTCGFGGRGAPCGGMSTHVAIVGTKDHDLDLVSVCARHVEEFYAAGRYGVRASRT